MITRTFITIDTYQFEVETVGKWTEKMFKEKFENNVLTPHLKWRNAYSQIKKAYAKVCGEQSSL